MSAILTLTRDVSFGIELVRHPFEILLDGTVVGSVAMRETAEVRVEPGSHRLRLRAGRRRSPERPFDAVDGQPIAFTCHGARIWPLWIASFVAPDLGIALKRD